MRLVVRSILAGSVLAGVVLVGAVPALADPLIAGEAAAPMSGSFAAAVPAATALAGGLTGGLVRDLPASLTRGLGSDEAAPAVGAMRLPTIRLLAPAVAISDALPGFRRRFSGNSMFEFYPSAASGFHFSGGTRLYSRRNFLKETEDSARGALSITRLVATPSVFRPGMRRFNPAMTAGYTMVLSSAARLGIEGGAMMGHLFAAAPGLPRQASGYRSENAAHLNPVANLVFGLRF